MIEHTQIVKNQFENVPAPSYRNQSIDWFLYEGADTLPNWFFLLSVYAQSCISCNLFVRYKNIGKCNIYQNECSNAKISPGSEWYFPSLISVHRLEKENCNLQMNMKILNICKLFLFLFFCIFIYLFFFLICYKLSDLFKPNGENVMQTLLISGECFIVQRLDNLRIKSNHHETCWSGSWSLYLLL